MNRKVRSLETLCFADFLNEGSGMADNHLERFVYGNEHFKISTD